MSATTMNPTLTQPAAQAAGSFWQPVSDFAGRSWTVIRDTSSTVWGAIVGAVLAAWNAVAPFFASVATWFAQNALQAVALVAVGVAIGFVVHMLLARTDAPESNPDAASNVDGSEHAGEREQVDEANLEEAQGANNGANANNNGANNAQSA